MSEEAFKELLNREHLLADVITFYLDYKDKLIVEWDRPWETWVKIDYPEVGEFLHIYGHDSSTNFFSRVDSLNRRCDNKFFERCLYFLGLWELGYVDEVSVPLYQAH